MLITPRIYRQYQIAKEGGHGSASSVLDWSTQRRQNRRGEGHKRMLLLHQTGSVKIGEVVRYAHPTIDLGIGTDILTAILSPTRPPTTAYSLRLPTSMSK